jgi:hypothetical protein
MDKGKKVVSVIFLSSVAGVAAFLLSVDESHSNVGTRTVRRSVADVPAKETYSATEYTAPNTTGPAPAQVAPLDAQPLSRKGTFEEELVSLGMREQIEPLASFLGISLNDRSEEYVLPPTMEVEAKRKRRIVVDGQYIFAFDRKGRYLARFQNGNRYSLPPTRDQSMTEEEALDLASRFLALALPDRRLVTPVISHKRDEWWIYENDYYEGIRTLAGVYLCIADRSDKVVVYGYEPLNLPDRIEQNISAEQAVEIAASFVAANGFAEVSPREPELEFRRVDNIMTFQPGDPLVMEEKMRLCWHICFDNENSLSLALPPHVLVDCATGEVVGGTPPSH